MFLSTSLQQWLLILCTLRTSSTAVYAAPQAIEQPEPESVCQVALSPNENVQTIIYLEPIHINTYVQTNGSFPVNDHLTVSVTNAPTSLDHVTTGTSTSLSTSTPTSS